MTFAEAVWRTSRIDTATMRYEPRERPQTCRQFVDRILSTVNSHVKARLDAIKRNANGLVRHRNV